MIKGFKGLTLDSTINDSEYYHSEEDDAESDPNSDPKVATHTSDRKKRNITDTNTNNRKSLHKLLINWLLLDIIPVNTPLVDLTTTDGVAASVGNLHACCAIFLLKEIVADSVRSAAHV